MRHNFRPVFFGSGGFQCFHQFEIRGLVRIGHDVKTVAVMIDAVFQTSNSFLENPEFSVGIVGFQYSVFGGQGASRFYRQVFSGLGFGYLYIVGFVFFEINQNVLVLFCP